MAARVGGWSARHRWWAILLWLAFVVLATVVGNAVGTTPMKSYEGQNGDSRRAQQIIDEAGFPDVAGEMVLVQARDGRITVDSPEFRQAVQDVASAVQATGQVEHLRTPYDPAAPAPRTADGTTALVLFDMTGAGDTADERVQPVLESVAGVQDRHPDLRVEQAGAASMQRLAGVAVNEDFQRAEALSLPITALILLIAFGTLLPMLIPLGVSMTAFFAATGLLALASKLLHVADTTTNMMLLIGLAVGVDYSLFYVRREREERARGRSKEHALEIAAATSGRAVLISGVTVIVAMAGMFLTGHGVFMGFAQGTILVVLTAMVASVTVLPATLAVFGDAVDARVIHGIVRVVTRGRVTWPRRLGGRDGGGRVWNVILTGVLRRPWLSTVLTVGVLVALAVPAVGMRLGQPGIDDLQGDYPIAATLKAIDRAFPGGNEPATVAVQAPDVSSPAMQEAIGRLKDRALATGVAHEPVSVQVNPAKTVATVSLSIGYGEQGRKSVAALRETIVPETVGAQPGARAYVTGAMAATMDFNRQMSRTAPLVLVFVLLLAFFLLLSSFRSIMVAIQAIVLNLLSVAVAYGVLVLVFQDGHGADLLGFTPGAIVNWLPLFLFVILFGLSMDYQVFILSRIREAYDSGMSTERAVTHGIKASAGVVTNAALIMVAVFAVFGTMSLLSFKQMGVGLAVAILIDATIVRAVLLPATMKLLGDRAWYLPSWLNWLPTLSHGEAAEEREDEPAPAREPVPVS
ncbi:MMPL family transporter [Micromonospora sp. DR5-3]|uniref:MMPL family transporter n=1 Tax=unclassified Micromonospora TaxID=2617518 RepID=UPI00210276DC|nr:MULTISPECIES: MMPL family transporter [unclassified Micromonospora]MCW3818372.1 MMPL family transporter [Micromonospora sp. DR5-3]